MPELVATARALAIDAVCADVVVALRAEDIDPVLLKGPTIADWLYPDTVRGYVDADLLVAPREIDRAASVLSRLGFCGVRPDLVRRHSEPWVRESDRAEIDLHVSLWGVDRPPAWVWTQLQPHLETKQLGPVRVRVLDSPMRTLYVVLHAAQHEGAPKQREDLIRALALTPDSTWPDVEALAHRLWALVGLAAGLALDAQGRRVLDRMPLAQAAMLLPQAPLAIGFARLAQARGLRAKLGVVASGARAPRVAAGAASPGEVARFAASIGYRIRLLASAPRTLLTLRRARRTRPGG
jgi:hypothetical protein